jgi:hypothetical protein
MPEGIDEQLIIELLQKSRSRHSYAKAIAEITGEPYEPAAPRPKPSRYKILKSRVAYRLHLVKLAMQVLRRGYHEDESDW